MTKILAATLEKARQCFPDGYFEEVVSKGIVNGFLVLDEHHSERRKQFFETRIKPIVKLQSVPRDQWPMWAQVLAKRAMAQDKGIGDVVARTIGAETSGAFKAFYEMTFGKPCGCNGRQKLWNQKYPLNLKAT